MGIRVVITHRTHYHYQEAVQFGPQVIRLRPAAHCRTAIESYSVTVRPREHFLNTQQDPFGNHLARVVVPKPSRLLSVDVRMVADLVPFNPFGFFLEPEAERMPVRYTPELATDLRPYLEVEPACEQLQELLRKVPHHGMRSVDFLVALNRQILHAVRYLVRMDPGVQTPEETLALGSGSCRDSAWLLVHAARHCGLAARFASGYSVQLAPAVGPSGVPEGPASDLIDLHAWAEIYLPGAGWIGLDATSGLFASEGHIPLACSPSPSSAAPISGGFTALGGDPDAEVISRMEVTMAVERLQVPLRTAAPYSDAEWASILLAGDAVDAHLNEANVRLTIGGEPTFIAKTERDAPEWNTSALGGTKRQRGYELASRLRRALAPGSLLHDGAGKWYPGEPLPRWALGLWWRADGEAVWQDEELIARDHCRPQLSAQDAERFILRLAERLQVEPGHALPAFEDALYHVWKEHLLPPGVALEDELVDEEPGRASLARVLSRGLSRVVGYALPLRPSLDGLHWMSGKWLTRAERLTLTPGDSPMGLRLPLSSLPWLTEEQRAAIQVVDLDPFAPRRPLPGLRTLSSQLAAGQLASGVRTRSRARPHEEIVRTALCVEAREGALRVFMPPLSDCAHFLELVALIEATAQEFAMPVAVEGYTPPRDPRLVHLAITPDPGVIEVNIHPQASWRQAVSTAETVYREADAVGLTAEKYLIDGKVAGSGGGNHITLGGARPADSPFLRRPDLLRSMIAYWHNHPALSYLFAGTFVGPSSQAPRSDEARQETVYELETALAQLQGQNVPPWLVDRVLRHLLVDATGNTHRTEICIDKLFSPDSATGRLGLVELRAFEMPPHARMHAMQQLLVRGLVARLWKDPYRAPLARWGSMLHDRFMLPAVLWEDLRGVLGDLREHHLPAQDEWFAPHRDFRFPVLGAVEHHGVRMELTQALEPWHVLGEESSGSGTVRYVDASVERIQVSLSGLNDDRHLAVCQGLVLPLQPLGVRGERVCGVRFRAWAPPSSLHPTIGLHAPLSIDLVDSWTGRTVAGCTYHVSHPGGRSYDTVPVNAAEAEARRSPRFQVAGGPERPLRARQPTIDRDQPCTLDLRRAALDIPSSAAVGGAGMGT